VKRGGREGGREEGMEGGREGGRKGRREGGTEGGRVRTYLQAQGNVSVHGLRGGSKCGKHVNHFLVQGYRGHQALKSPLGN